jgi:Uri superfamily endonuclease
VLQVSEQCEITVGKLGTFPFAAGYYVYFGRMLNSLEGRFQRHLRPDKKLHWHIDYLSHAARIVEI